MKNLSAPVTALLCCLGGIGLMLGICFCVGGGIPSPWKWVVGIVLYVLLWYEWGFFVQWINFYRGFREDWFLWGFMSVFFGPISTAGVFVCFRQPILEFLIRVGIDFVPFFSVEGLTLAYLLAVLVLEVLGLMFLPIVVAIIAWIRPRGVARKKSA